MSRRRKEKDRIKIIAHERIVILLERADKVYSEEPELAQRYGELAKKIAMKARIRMPEKWRIRYCLKCKKYLYPGISARVRLKASKKSRIVYYCSICGKGVRSKTIQKE